MPENFISVFRYSIYMMQIIPETQIVLYLHPSSLLTGVLCSIAMLLHLWRIKSYYLKLPLKRITLLMPTKQSKWNNATKYYKRVLVLKSTSSPRMPYGNHDNSVDHYVCVTDNHRYVPFGVITIWPFRRSCLIIVVLTKVTQRAPLVEEYCINWETYTSCVGAAGMLLYINGKSRWDFINLNRRKLLKQNLYSSFLSKERMYVFGWTRSGHEPKTYRTRSEHANNYTTDAVRRNVNQICLDNHKTVHTFFGQKWRIQQNYHDYRKAFEVMTST
jgi:hypothetical protein